MTNVQVQYWGMKEDQRHNIATEYETNRHNVTTEKQNAVAIGETVRHNKVTEAETQRHNQQQEALGFATLAETNRHNVVTEQETHRHNVSSEGIQQLQASASMLSAQAAMKNANTAAEKAKSEIALNTAKTQFTKVTGTSALMDLRIQEGKQKVKETLAPLTGVLESIGLSNTGGVASTVAGALIKTFI